MLRSETHFQLSLDIHRFLNQNTQHVTQVEVQEHPVYHFNVLALRISQIAALIIAGARLLFGPNNESSTVSILVAGLAVLFYVLERFLFPRLKTIWALDLSVAAYNACIYGLICCAVTFTPEHKTSAGLACMLTIPGLLFIRNGVFIAMAIIGVASWILTHYAVGSPIKELDMINLIVTAPATAVVARIAVLTSSNANYRAKKQEQESVLNLENTLVRLQTETR